MNTRKFKVKRSTRSWILANIILDQGLFSDYLLWRELHPKIKSNVRAGSLYLLNKKLRYRVPTTIVPVNMDTLEDYCL